MGRATRLCVLGLVLVVGPIATEAQEAGGATTDPQTAAAIETAGGSALALTRAVGNTCTAIAGGLDEKVPFAWPCDEPPLEGDEAMAACRKSLLDALVEGVGDELRTRSAAKHAEVLVQPRGRSAEALPFLLRLGDDFDGAVEDALDRLEEHGEQRFAALDLAQATAKEGAEKAWKELVAEAAARFADRCRGDVVPQLASVLALQSFRDDAEAAHFADLNKKDGFSSIVRCQWLRVSGESDRLDCLPGLRLSGQDAATIQILPPLAEPGFRLAWVQATTAEEGKHAEPLVATSCPGYAGDDPRKLSCDELCFTDARSGSPAVCAQASQRPVPAQSATIAVHMPRAMRTSYGCGTSSADCALKRLRGPADGVPLQREKLSLVLRGKTPYIVVHAIDSEGRLALGTVLLGYERWRVETGGFLAVTPLVDEETVPLAVGTDGKVTIGETTFDVGQGQVAVGGVREADDWAQETGVFVNFIPRNYETLGIGFGLATHEGGAPSVYLGPVLRLRSFGHRGLAALSGGIVMREVDRFPDLVPGVYQADSAFLQPDPRFDHDWFVGIQLGFSFGSISVPGDSGTAQ